MLEDNTVMHAEIAYSCGFASQSHFCTSFKAVVGMTATEWRNSLKKAVITMTSSWGGAQVFTGMPI